LSAAIARVERAESRVKAAEERARLMKSKKETARMEKIAELQKLGDDKVSDIREKFPEPEDLKDILNPQTE
jgi:GTP1/Obg family GTP-binding protein